MSHRIEYIDSMRGLAMVLVVYSHIIYFCGLNDFLSLNSIVTNIRMPLFFFISGYLSYSIYNKELLVKRIKNRITSQLLPTISILTIYCLTIENDIISAYISESKMGYWFTYVLFLTFCVCVPVLYVFDKYKIDRKWKSIYFLVFAIVCLALYVKESATEKTIYAIFSLRYFLRYAAFFIFGMISRMYNEKYHRIIHSKYMALLCVGIMTLLFHIESRFIIMPYALCGILLTFHLFSFIDGLSSIKSIGKMLACVGRNTLPIYLVHYFFVFYISSFVKNMNIESINDNPLLGFVFMFILSFAIVIICLIVQRMVMLCKPLYYILFGVSTYKGRN